MPFVYFLLLAPLVFIYIILIAPMRKRMRQQQLVASQVVVGDTIVTTAGIFGVIAALDEDVAELDIAPGVRIKVARGVIADKVVEETARLAHPDELEHSTVEED